MSSERDASGHRIERVQLPDGRSYPVVVGRGARNRLAELVPDGVRRVAVITQAGIGVEVDPGTDPVVLSVPEGEDAKRMEVVEGLCRTLAREGFTRSDLIVAVGGGVVTDVGGFTASLYHRGIRVIHVATSLLGQIDAAIGGKTAVNIPEGKNLVGTFWQPTAVVCDTETLETLPDAEFRAGLGELAKYHFLGGGDLDALDLEPRIAACVRIKADVVAADEREGGRRAILNYGHTLAHALETASGFRIRHGAAVAVGLLYAAELARLLGRVDSAAVDEHRRVLGEYGLETSIGDWAEPESLIDLFWRDKKAVDGVTFVLDGPDGVEPVVVDNRSALIEAFGAVR